MCPTAEPHRRWHSCPTCHSTIAWVLCQHSCVTARSVDAGRKSDRQCRLSAQSESRSRSSIATHITSLTSGLCCRLFSYRHVNRTLRFASQPPLLSIPASQTVTHGDHRFAVCSAVLWNNLPSFIRTATTVYSFKTLLKTHLFRQAFL